MSIKTLIILAPGFEEVEAIAVVDVLRRAQIEVVIAGLDAQIVASARQVSILADTVLSEVKDLLFDAVILPGGEPGTTNLQKSPLVEAILQRHFKAEKLIAAICAAPRILDALGMLDGRSATSFPGTQSAMTRCRYSDLSVVHDGHVITSRGAGTALAFGLAILAYFTSDSQALGLADQMQVSGI